MKPYILGILVSLIPISFAAAKPGDKFFTEDLHCITAVPFNFFHIQGQLSSPKIISLEKTITGQMRFFNGEQPVRISGTKLNTGRSLLYEIKVQDPKSDITSIGINLKDANNFLEIQYSNQSKLSYNSEQFNCHIQTASQEIMSECKELDGSASFILKRGFFDKTLGQIQYSAANESPFSIHDVEIGYTNAGARAIVSNDILPTLTMIGTGNTEVSWNSKTWTCVSDF